MLTVSFPILLLLLPLPLLLQRWLPIYRSTRTAIRVAWFQRTADLLGHTPGKDTPPTKKSVVEITIAWLSWFFIITALARPQFIQQPLSQIVPTRDILLAVDLSGSMETEDFTDATGKKIDRLTAVKEVLDDFLSHRQGDRVGLIVFGNAPFVQIPFTQDLKACKELLAETGLRMAGPKTAFGDAIGLGITLFASSKVDDRVMIVLTDGNDTGSTIPPAEAAKIAKDHNIVIHVIGIGDAATPGEEKLDEEALRQVASNTSGRYFHGSNRDELAAISTELDKMNSHPIETLRYSPAIDLFYLPLALALLLQLAFCFMVLVHTFHQHKKTQDGEVQHG